jgi:hypothetical protein
MGTYATKLEVYREAFPLVGAQPPTATEGQTADLIFANASYEGIVSGALTQHAWSFATKRSTLAYQGETGDSPAYAYQIPADVLLPRYVLLNKAKFRDYEIRNGQLLCDVSQTDEIDLIYAFRADEEDWPADFGQAIVHMLAGRIARGLLDRAAQGRELEAIGERLMHQARTRDRRSQGPLVANDDPSLVRAWRGASRLLTETPVARTS